MSTVLTGPARELGLDMRAGVECAFTEYNRTLGPGMLPVHLIVLDDGYEPDRCGPNMRELVEKEGVLAVVGNVGTPTAIAALPIAVQRRVPFFGAFTGAGVLRKTPADRYVINYRASYAEETAAMVDALVACGVAPEEIGFFTQRDGYGDAGFTGGISALTRHGLSSEGAIVHGRYERNTVAVDSALAELLLAPTPIRAVIMVGTYAPCAAFIHKALAANYHPLFMNVSFVGASSLSRALGAEGEGVVITQVVPHYASDLPICKDFRSALASVSPEESPSSVSLEGYIVGRIFCRALSTLPGVPSRESIVDHLLEQGRFDLGLGTELDLSPTEHQACHKVWINVIHGGHVVPFEWSDLAHLLPRK